MVFDGCRALAVGDYLTPSSGPYAGQLGPWAPLVQALGIPPRATAMKLLFVAYGGAWLGACAAFLLRRPRATGVMAAFAAGSLWYLVIGTACSALQLLCLAALARRRTS